MKSLALVILAAAAGVLHASPVYQCSYNAGGYTVAGCYSTTTFINTNDFLDWGNQNGHAVPDGVGSGLGSAISNSRDVGINDQTPWLTNTNNGAVEVGLGIMPTSFTGSSIIDRYDNLGLAQKNNGTGWVTAGSVSGLQSFQGHFDGPSDSTSQYSLQTDYTGYSTPLKGYIGDHLVGLQTSASGILITFSSPVYAVGFRASAKSDSQSTNVGGTAVQDLKVSAYDIINPTSSTQALLSYELQDSGGFGTCIADGTLVPPPPSHVTPCNDAPFIGIDSQSALFTTAPLVTLPNSPWISSIFISSTDSTGFLIDELFIQDAADNTPEPGVLVLIGSGLFTIGFLARRRSTGTKY